MSEKHVKQSGDGFSWLTLLLGVGFGIAVGLFYTWEIDPVIERNTAPWQLSDVAREDYVVAVALSYAHSPDLKLAFDRLRAVSPDRNVWSMVADIACERYKTGQTTTYSDIRVIRALNQLYLLQGASDCADAPFPTPAPVIFPTPAPTLTATPTLPPPLTKTPTPPRPTNAPTPVAPVTPDGVSSGRYVLGRLQSFCDPDLGGVLEVRVYDYRGQGVPGIPVQVMWSGNKSDRFFTGLQPERELGYADFEMMPGHMYTVSIPDLVSNQPSVEAVPCDVTVDGQTITTTTSYWLNFNQRQP